MWGVEDRKENSYTYDNNNNNSKDVTSKRGNEYAKYNKTRYNL